MNPEDRLFWILVMLGCVCSFIFVLHLTQYNVVKTEFVSSLRFTKLLLAQYSISSLPRKSVCSCSFSNAPGKQKIHCLCDAVNESRLFPEFGIKKQWKSLAAIPDPKIQNYYRCMEHSEKQPFFRVHFSLFRQISRRNIRFYSSLIKNNFPDFQQRLKSCFARLYPRGIKSPLLFSRKTSLLTKGGFVHCIGGLHSFSRLLILPSFERKSAMCRKSSSSFLPKTAR
jgi:hypothetical protein